MPVPVKPLDSVHLLPPFPEMAIWALAAAALLGNESQRALVDALFAATRNWAVSLHFNKGLAGAPEAVRAEARDSAINPAAADAFALAIVSSHGEPAFPGIAGNEPDEATGRRNVAAINAAMDEAISRSAVSKVRCRNRRYRGSVSSGLLAKNGSAVVVLTKPQLAVEVRQHRQSIVGEQLAQRRTPAKPAAVA